LKICNNLDDPIYRETQAEEISCGEWIEEPPSEIPAKTTVLCVAQSKLWSTGVTGTVVYVVQQSTQFMLHFGYLWAIPKEPKVSKSQRYTVKTTYKRQSFSVQIQYDVNAKPGNQLTSNLHNTCLVRHIRRDITTGSNKLTKSLRVPVLVFVHPNQNHEGDALLELFRSLLPKEQVYHVEEDDPVEVLQRFRFVPDLRVVVCGSDECVLTAIQAIDNLDLPDQFAKPTVSDS
jgi:hypothetical protein